MPNQNNFRSDVTTTTEPRFLASRIVSFPEEEILFEQIPASFGYDVFDNIEIHFYSAPENNLIASLVVAAEEGDVLKSHVVSYEDGTFKNYIRIDFTALFQKKQIILLPGDYKVVMNFFADEIGSYNDRRMYIQEISDSRTEVQLQFFDTRNLQDRVDNIDSLKEFVPPSFSRPVAIGVAEKIFRSGVQLVDDTEGLTYNNILENIELDSSDVAQTVDNTIERVKRLSAIAENGLKDSINNFLPRLYEKIREEIVIRGDRRIQEDEFKEFIEEVVDNELKYLQSTIDRRILLS
jgi:hypothetical protein